jgi:hypothetical protein
MEQSLELICDDKLKRVLDKMSHINPTLLRKIDCVESLVQECGLVMATPEIYGDDQKHLNPLMRGLWQIPRQLAAFAVFLSNHKIESFLEVGTFTGGTFTFLMGYLTRFNPHLVGITIDPWNANPPTHLWNGRFRGRYVVASSRDFAAQSFDLCLIDGFHSFDAVTEDYLNVGRYSRICGFHDINDQLVEEWPNHNGGVVRFWRQLREEQKGREFHEFLFHSHGARVMGIGVIVHNYNIANNSIAVVKI